MGDNNSHVGDSRYLALAFRQALIIMLGALECYLGLERSIEPKHKREKQSSN